jgi:hypothetical protein
MSDRYTKIVLTVIAAALIGLVAQNAVGPLNAVVAVQKVQICDPNGECATLSPYPGLPGAGGRPGATQTLHALSVIQK